jgi:hypothetical protein
MKLTVKQLLIRARKKIQDQKHWCKRAYQVGRGIHISYCALGALYSVGKGTVNCGKAEAALNQAVRTLPNMWHTGIIGYNDDPVRSHEEVLKVYDLAIKSQPRRG